MANSVNGLVLWLLPLSWLIHDIEEIATVEAWSRRWDARRRAGLSTLQRRLVRAITSTRRQFTLAAALVGCVVVGATVAGVVNPNGLGIVIYTTRLGGYFIHALGHVGQSVVCRGYTPGLATAVIVVLPASLGIYWRLLSSNLVDNGTLVATGLLGLVLFVPVVVGANRIADQAERWWG